MKKRVGAIEEFMFLPLTEGRQLHITIAITGWLGSGRYREDRCGEGLRWEPGLPLLAGASSSYFYVFLGCGYGRLIFQRGNRPREEIRLSSIHLPVYPTIHYPDKN